MAEASPLTPYSSEYLSLLARKGKLPSKKIQNTWYTTKSAVEDYMQKQMLRSQIQNGNFPSVQNIASKIPVVDTQLVKEELLSSKPTIQSVSLKPHVENLSKAMNIDFQESSALQKIRSYGGDMKRYFPETESASANTDTGTTHPEVEHVERVLERVLDKKLFETHIPSLIHKVASSDQGKLTTKRVVEKLLMAKHVQTALSSRLLGASAVLAFLIFSVLPLPVVSSFAGRSVSYVREALTDANTLMGFRPGTHANEVLLLDKQGNISIMGHIETGGQLRSYVEQGVAPIVVDSTSTVANLSADYLDGVTSEEFTLAFVTRNGSVTTEDVTLGGRVEVGETLTVRGATKLLSALEVDGDLKVFGQAEFAEAIDVLGPAYFKQLVTIDDNLRVNKNISVRGSLEAGSSVVARGGSFSALSASASFNAGGKVVLGNPKEYTTVDAKNFTINSAGDAAFDGTVTAVRFVGGTIDATSFSTTNSTTTNATTTNLYVSGLASTTEIRANTAILSNITSLFGDFSNLLLTGSSTLQNFTFVNATGSAATTTNFFSTTASSTNLFSTSANIGSLTLGFGTFSNLLLTGSTTLQNFTAVNSTTTNATSSTFGIIGNSAGLLFTGTGNHDILATTGALRVGTSTVLGDISAQNNAINIGSPGTRFRTIYADEVNASSLVGTLTGGNLTAETFNINSDNATADTEDSYLSFERGSLSPNALLQWDSTNDRFVFNSDLFINSGIGNGSLLVNSSTTLQNFTFVNATGSAATTTNFFSTTASSTNLFSSLLSVGGIRGLNVISGGNVGIGTTNPLSKFNIRGNTDINLNAEASGSVFDVAATNDANNALIPLQLRGSAIYLNPSGGNVGIGTTNPLEKFDSRGAMFISGDNSTSYAAQGAAHGLLIHSAAGVARITAATNGANDMDLNLRAVNGGSVNDGQLFLDSEGNVGIGTTTPPYRLTVDSSTDTILNINSTNAGGDSRIRFSNTADGTSWMLGGDDDGVFRLFYNDSTKLSIDTSDNLTYSGGQVYFTGGNVGIGTTVPIAPLHTYASLGSTSSILPVAIFGRNNTFDESRGFSIDLTTSDSGGNTATTSRITTYSDTSTWSSTLSTRDSVLGFQTSLDGVLGTKMTINSNGNVGIGTTNPAQKLEVSGTGNTTVRVVSTDGGSSFPIFQLFQTGGSTWNIENGRDGDGALGFYSGGQKYKFGTTQMTLDGPDIRVQSSQADLPLISLSDTTNSQIWNIENGRDAIGNLGFYNGGTKFVISSSGNVGIGTTNPGRHFVVFGSDPVQAEFSNTSTDGSVVFITKTDATDQSWGVGVAASAHASSIPDRSFYIRDETNASNRFVINTSGNVGIGTTNPSSTLDVAGGIEAVLPAIGANTGQLVLYKSDGTLTTDTTQLTWDSSNDNLSVNGLILGSTFVRSSGSNDLSLGSANTFPSITVLGATGNVGIGTTSPSSLLNAHAGSITITGTTLNQPTTGIGAYNTALKLTYQDPAEGTGWIDGFTDNAGYQALVLRGISASNPTDSVATIEYRASKNDGGTSVTTLGSAETAHQFTNNGTALMSILGGGNVGIGTTNPSKKLDISATAGDSSSQSGLRVTRTDNTAIYADLYPRNSYAENGMALDVSGFESLFFSSADGDIILGGSSVGAASVTNSKLTVNGGVNIGYAASNAAPTDGLLVEGNVGIGTTTPLYKFEINGAGSTLARLEGTAGQGAGLTMGSWSGTQWILGPGMGTLSNANDFAIHDSTNNNTAFVVKSSTGNVGIGTTNPVRKLEVAGNMLFSDSAPAFDWVDTDDNSNYRIRQVGAETVLDIDYNAETANSSFGVYLDGTANSNNKFTVLSSGNVGIGTTNPNDKLQVKSATGVNAGVNIDTTDADGATSDAALTFSEAGTTKWQIRNDGSDTDALLFRNASSEEIFRLTQARSFIFNEDGLDADFRIESDGNANLLTVDASANNIGFGASPNSRYFADFGGAGSNAFTSAATLTSDSAYALFRPASVANTSGTGNIANVIISGGTSLNPTGASTWGAGLIVGGPSEGGAGSFTNMASLLVEDAPSGGSNNYSIYSAGSAQSYFAGNVGIGVTNPNVVLDISSAQAGVEIVSTAGTNNAYTRYGNNGGSFYVGRDNSAGGSLLSGSSAYAAVFGSGGAYPMQFGTNDTVRMTIGATGNVGIGTTGPVARFQVQSASGASNNSYFTTADYNDSNTGSGMLIDFGASSGNTYTRLQAFSNGSALTNNLVLNPSGGNVGIGLTNPQSTFHVKGGSAIFDNPAGAIRVLQTASTLGNNDLGIWNKAGGGGDVFALADWNTGTKGVFINTNNGNVGVGTSTPQYALTSYATDAAQLSLSAGAGVAQWAFRNAGGNLYLATTTVAGTATTSVSALSIMESTGNLGIGTTTPVAKLGVAGLIYAGGSSGTSTIEHNLEVNGALKVGSSSVYINTNSIRNLTGDLYLQPGSGNVGIGTTTAMSKLTVAGGFNVISTSESSIPVSATGGTITTSGSYTVHTFTSSGTFSANGAVAVEYLVVAGGGGGGARGGGGGGGGMLTGSMTVSAGDKTVTVGQGGTAGVVGVSAGGNGGDSVFATITATGGGGGGTAGIFNGGVEGKGSSGGSGGGSQSSIGVYATGTVGQGNDGGGGGYGSIDAAGGGGGAGAVGETSSASEAADGGAGLASSISGASVTYAGGGGGGANATGGTGGSGGGGGSGCPGVAGTANTGGGGGGGNNGCNGAIGGSGIVIVRYLTAATVSASSSGLYIDTSGYVGIGTSTPYVANHVYSVLDTNIFRLQDADGTCNYNPESGSVTVSCSSDQRLKTDIRDTSSALKYLSSLKVKDYTVIASGNQQTGLIAQEALETHPELVTMGNDGYYQVAEVSSWKLIKAIQELDNKFEEIIAFGNLDDTATNTATSTGTISQATEFASRFFGSITTKMTKWFASATNGIGDFFANRVKTKELCVGDEFGAETCIQKSQLDSLLASAGITVSAMSSNSGSSEGDTASSTTSFYDIEIVEDVTEDVTTDTGDTATSTPAVEETPPENVVVEESPEPEVVVTTEPEPIPEPLTPPVEEPVI